jgi:tetratricopeptide (TPR) repeat protein
MNINCKYLICLVSLFLCLHNNAITQDTLSKKSIELLKLMDTIEQADSWEQRINYCSKALNKAFLLSPDYKNDIGHSKIIASIYFLSGAAKVEGGEHAQAILDYNMGIELDPKYFKAYKDRGNAKQVLRQWANAIADFDKAILLNSKDVATYRNRGLAKCSLQKQNEAIADFDKAIQLDAKNAETYRNRGVAKMEMGRSKEAIIDFDTAIQLEPSTGIYYIARGIAKKELPNYGEALIDLNAGIKLDSSKAEAYVERGVVNALLGLYEEAIRDLSQAIQMDSTVQGAYEARYLIYNGLGLYELALADFDKLPTGKRNPIARANLVAHLQVTDTIGPVITLDTTRGSVATGVQAIPVNQSLYKVRGTVTDPIGIQSITLNGQAVPLTMSSSSKGVFETTLSLVQGEQTCVLQAADTKGNESEIRWRVEYQPMRFRGLALVIGNTNYENMQKLGHQPLNDARDIADSLQKVDFKVIKVENRTKKQLEDTIREFASQLADYPVGLVFYAGHGFGIEGVNYFVPIECPKNMIYSDVKSKCVSTDWIQNKMKNAGIFNKTNIIIVDACRDDGGLRNIRINDTTTWEKKMPLTGFLTCFGASLGQTASNGNGRNGLYTHFLLKHMLTPNLKIEDLFKRVRQELVELSEKDKKIKIQIPEEQSQLMTDFYFKLEQKK